MKSFLSTRAGGSFFCGSNRTVVYHKDNIEFILRVMTHPMAKHGDMPISICFSARKIR